MDMPVVKAAGYTLVELLISILLSLLLIMSITQLFIVGQKQALRQTARSQLSHYLAQVNSQLQQEIRRAGFYDKQGEALVLDPNTATIEFGASELDFAYLNEYSEFQQISIRQDGDALDICANRKEQKQFSRRCRSHYFALLDERRFKIKQFLVTSEPAFPNLLQIAITLCLHNETFCQSITSQVNTRNPASGSQEVKQMF